MKSKAIILFLVAVFILVFISACSTPNTSETVITTAKITTETTSAADQQYYKEITRISHALKISIDVYYQACDDFLNFDIDLSEHKKATEVFVRAVLYSSSSFEELKPPEKYIIAHNLFGTSLEHFNNGAGYLNQYIKASGDDMNTYLEKAIPEIEQAAKYLNQANKEIKNVNQ